MEVHKVLSNLEAYACNDTLADRITSEAWLSSIEKLVRAFKRSSDLKNVIMEEEDNTLENIYRETIQEIDRIAKILDCTGAPISFAIRDKAKDAALELIDEYERASVKRQREIIGEYVLACDIIDLFRRSPNNLMTD